MNRRPRVNIEEIEFKDVSFGYNPDACFLEHIDFKFPTQTVVWIKGHSGCGKSSLLKMMVGILAPSRGQYLINGIDVSELSFEEFLPYRLAMGYSFDIGGLISNRTLFENLALPLMYHGEGSSDEISHWVSEVLEIFGISKEKDQRPAMVPGRTRKACVVARSLIMKPQMLVLDDPLMGLSKEMINSLMTLISIMQKHWGLKHIFIGTGHETFGNPAIEDMVEISERRLMRQQNLKKSGIFAL